MTIYIVWLKLPSGHVQTHKVRADSLSGAIILAIQEGRDLQNHPGTRAIFACEEGVA